MKVYQKPFCETIELRSEENIAIAIACKHPNWVNNNDFPSGCWVTSGS